MKYTTVVALAVAVMITTTAPVSVLAETAQQIRMKECNTQAKGKTGEERKSFMKSCLSGKAGKTYAPMTAQQMKMKECNAQAKGMKGEEHKKFMSSCLKKK